MSYLVFNLYNVFFIEVSKQKGFTTNLKTIVIPYWKYFKLFLV